MSYAYKTENTYCDWVKRFIQFSKMQNKQELFKNADNKVEAFLTDLAVRQNVASSTQNQAFNALVFLYKTVLERPLENVRATRSRKEPRIPVVLSIKEVKKILSKLRGTNICLPSTNCQTIRNKCLFYQSLFIVGVSLKRTHQWFA